MRRGAEDVASAADGRSALANPDDIIKNVISPHF